MDKLELRKETMTISGDSSLTGSFFHTSRQDCVSSSARPCYDKQTGKKIIGLEPKGGERAFAACLKSKVIGSSGSYMAETPICDREKFLYCYEGKSKVFLRKFEGVCGETQTEPEPNLNCPRVAEFYPLSYLDASWSMSSPTQEYWIETMLKSRSGALFVAGFKIDYGDESHWGGWIPVMYKSTDNGKSWNFIKLPYSETSLTTWIMVHSIVEDKDGVLYAGGNRLWKSADGGNTWDAQPSLPYPSNYWGGELPITYMVVAKDNSLIAVFQAAFSTAKLGDPDYVRPRISRSTDGGSTWNELFSNDYYITSIVEADDGSIVFRDSIGGNPGSVYSYSNGIVTKTFTDGPAAMDFNAALFKASDGSIYIISVDEFKILDGIEYTQPGAAYLSAYKSTDNGITWTQLGSLPNSWELQGGIVEGSDGTMHTTSWSTCYRAETVYTSTDKGATWSIIANAPIFGKGKHPDPYFRYEILSFIEVSGKVLIAGNAPVIFSTP